MNITTILSGVSQGSVRSKLLTNACFAPKTVVVSDKYDQTYTHIHTRMKPFTNHTRDSSTRIMRQWRNVNQNCNVLDTLQ